MSNGKLTSTSYVVLGLVGLLGQATSYDLKGLVGLSIGHFWTFPHSQLYAEPERLVGMGLLSERREEGGRRRRIYSITPEGRAAFDEWLADPVGEAPELRDPGTLKLFFGNFAGPENVRRLAEAQVRQYEESLQELRGIQEQLAEVTGLDYQLATLRLGLAVSEATLAFWKEIAEQPLDSPGG